MKQTFEKPINTCAVSDKDRYLIIDQRKNRIIESWGTFYQAIHFCRILNNQGIGNYYVFDLLTDGE